MAGCACDRLGVWINDESKGSWRGRYDRRRAQSAGESPSPENPISLNSLARARELGGKGGERGKGGGDGMCASGGLKS